MHVWLSPWRARTPSFRKLVSVTYMIQSDHINSDTDLGGLHLNYVRSRCMEESDHFFQRQEYDPRFCFELFRRAITLRDQLAWEYIYLQYRPLVSVWIERHPIFHALDDDVEFFVNRVFEKMWSMLTPEKLALSPGLSAVLSYLHKCVNSVLIDTMRAHERLVVFSEEEEEQNEPREPEEQSPEQKTLRRDAAGKLWAMLAERCKDEKERAAAYGSFVLALKVSEVYEAYPGIFKNVQEIYRVKENLLARWKRDQALMDFLEG